MGTDSPALSGTLVDLRPRTLLRFLALTGKTGVLRAREHDRRAAVWLRRGAVVGTEGLDLLDGVVDLLRMPNGDFEFDECEAPFNGDGVPLTALLDEAATVLADWEETAQAVPSTTLVIELCHAHGDADPVAGDAWAVSVAVAAGHTTPARVAAEMRWGMLRTCRAVKDLVDSRRAMLLPPVRSTGMLSGPAQVVLTSGAPAPALWPGAGVGAEGPWRTPWYDPGE